ncbi:MAG: hypothetical protein RLZZ324_1243 [Candidatus Parcubacteria bacterium]|jgi:nicotinamidase-related amidase
MAIQTYKELPIPAFYNAKNASAWGFAPDPQKTFEAAAAWRAKHGIEASGAQKANIHLLLIDVQRDFCFPEGALYVAGRSGTGAIDDTRRIAEFIYRNTAVIKDITTTLDTHFLFQIFFPSFWLRQDGTHPTPHTVVTTAMIKSGELAPNPAVAAWLCNGNLGFLKAQVQHYCEELEKAGKYTLYLWPFHCLAETPGHALAGLVAEARMFHNFVRSSQSYVEVKGGHPLTENYSVLRPEVLTRYDGKALAQKNVAFIKKLMTVDALIIAGQADSHCVASSIDDLLTEIVAQDAALAEKVYVMTDCMSAVTVPDGKGGFVADFTPQAEAAHKRFADAGMHLVQSTDPVASWPGIRL